ncbi:hypothetical protein MLD38_026302 [Melastoma candidum]|uniref:Uncharacterized protein n=1 Tax=Melastoma candidum TaxID=119954 RepID=A0ACB9P1D3_9MYRT|nr:hypothetical protein MLD38_026302 [Melastoma candidum]
MCLFCGLVAIIDLTFYAENTLSGLETCSVPMIRFLLVWNYTVFIPALSLATRTSGRILPHGASIYEFRDQPFFAAALHNLQELEWSLYIASFQSIANKKVKPIVTNS